MADKKPTVLLVDDDKFLLGMYSLKFKNNGLEVGTAVGPVDALQQLRGGVRPDILVLDIIMPVMDGIELLKAIKSEKLAQQSIVIMLTNQGQSSDIARAQELGVEGYIVKASTIPSEVLKEVLKIWDVHKNKYNK